MDNQDLQLLIDSYYENQCTICSKINEEGATLNGGCITLADYLALNNVAIIVHCNDCKFYDKNWTYAVYASTEVHYCLKHKTGKYKDYYCADGEKSNE